MGLCGPEDVVDGSSSQHLPHGLINDLWIIATANRHGAQETYNKHLLQEGICENITPTQICQQHNPKDTQECELTIHGHTKRQGELKEVDMVTVTFCRTVIICFPKWICPSVKEGPKIQ